MSAQLTANISLDGYHLIRFLGRGGFGEVWLCRSESMGGYHALKFIAGSNPDLLEKEHQSLALYRKAAGRLRSPHLVPIEHINRHTAGCFCVIMPMRVTLPASTTREIEAAPTTVAKVAAERRTTHLIPGGRYGLWESGVFD